METKILQSVINTEPPIRRIITGRSAWTGKLTGVITCGRAELTFQHASIKQVDFLENFARQCYDTGHGEVATYFLNKNPK